MGIIGWRGPIILGRRGGERKLMGRKKGRKRTKLHGKEVIYFLPQINIGKAFPSR